jgi:ankyrin repeat protein
MSEADRVRFIEAAVWHGTLLEAEAMLAADPSLGARDIHTAAIVGDDAAVRRFLAEDPSSATRTSAPYGGDALTYLCLSRYLRLAPDRSAAFVRAAQALLDAGADANAGFWVNGDRRERETALYGAAGVAHHAELTALLLRHGADPNDEEVVYHSPEGYDNRAMALVVETGQLTPASLTLMLVRKADWHDIDGARFLLEHGANPNERWGLHGLSALHHGIERDNALEMIALMLDHGGDPRSVQGGRSAVERAARRGRGDLLTLFAERGFPVELPGAAGLMAACARDDVDAVRAARQDGSAVEGVLAAGGALLAEFAGVGNTPGVRQLLDLGVPASARYGGDGYFGVAPESTALHVAAWRLRPSVVQLLLERGAPVDARDALGRTALQMAVKACVDSYWMERRTPETVRLLLTAGASSAELTLPTGYDAVDVLLQPRR